MQHTYSTPAWTGWITSHLCLEPQIRAHCSIPTSTRYCAEDNESEKRDFRHCEFLKDAATRLMLSRMKTRLHQYTDTQIHLTINASFMTEVRSKTSQANNLSKLDMKKHNYRRAKNMFLWGAVTQEGQISCIRAQTYRAYVIKHQLLG